MCQKCWHPSLELTGVNTRDAGARYEDLAEAYLQRAGLITITRNFNCRMGEIDRIMTDDGTLVFVEVRYRADPGFVSPLASITPMKQRRLIRTAQFYLQRNPRFAGYPYRFDAIGITGSLEDPRFNWIKGAFSA